MDIIISERRDIVLSSVIELYTAVGWSAALKPDQLYQGLLNSHSLITAWNDAQLIGLGNAISDGHLVVYYPHMIVHPDYQGQGVGALILERLQSRYEGFHMQMLTADGRAVDFYNKHGFKRAGDTVPMWIYGGDEH